jgi:hypothetical protein
MRRPLLFVLGLLAWVIPVGVQAQSEIPPLPDRNPLRPGALVEAAPLKPGEYPSVPWTEAEVKTATEECKTLLGAEVVVLRNATSYSCRNRYGGPNTPLSEHAFANALDVAEFILASGDHVTVLDSWPKKVALSQDSEANTERNESGAETTSAKTTKPSNKKGSSVVSTANAEPAPEADAPPAEDPPKPDPKGQFLKLIHDKACQRFGTTLGPEANAAHKNHFHLDQKKRRSGFCE